MNKIQSSKAVSWATPVLLVLPQMAMAEDGYHELGEIVVSAAGVAVDPLTAPASVTVVTAEELKRAGVTSLTDALKSVPGVSVAGAADGQNIFIRGLPSEYTLILVDGKRQSTRESRTNSSGGVEQYYIPPVSAIERIEIVRGPMSSLYGSDAMGGVINVITKPVSDTWTGSVTLESTIAESSSDSEEAQTSFYLNGPVVSDTLGVQLWGRYLDRSESARDRGPGERQLSDLYGRLTWSPSADHRFTLEGGRTEIDTYPRLNTRESASLGYVGTLGAWDITSSLAFEKGGRVTDGSDRKPDIKNTVLDAKASRAFSWKGEHDFTFGGQYLNADLKDQNPGLDDGEHYSFSNTQWALFAEDIWQISDRFSLTLGGRFTEDERFGGKFTPRVYGLWEVSDGLFLSAGAAQGYRTPELRESVEDYYQTTNRGAAVIQGNPDLKPEESDSYELGLRFQRGGTMLNATAFYTNFSNKIDSRDTGTTITVGGTDYDLYEYYNVGKGRIRGFELSADQEITPDLILKGSYTYTDSERQSGDLVGQPLSRTPMHQASLNLDWRTSIDGLSVWGQANYFGESVSVSSTSRGSSATEYDAYGTVDIGASYALNDNVVLKGAIYNLGDANINHDSNGTVLNGRTLWLAVTTEF